MPNSLVLAGSGVVWMKIVTTGKNKLPRRVTTLMMLYLSCNPQRLGGLDRTEPVRLPQVEIL